MKWQSRKYNKKQNKLQKQQKKPEKKQPKKNPQPKKNNQKTPTQPIVNSCLSDMLYIARREVSILAH